MCRHFALLLFAFSSLFANENVDPPSDPIPGKYPHRKPICMKPNPHSVNALSSLGLKNGNAYDFVLTGSNGSDANCKDACYPVLATNGQQWVDIYSASGWIDVEYDICSSVTYDPQGKPQCQGWLGHLGISFSAAQTKISNVSGGTATLSGYVAGQPFTVTFTPSSPPPPPHFPTPSSYSGVMYRGVNLAGAEFDDAFHIPYASDALYYVQKGMNIMRIPFKLEYIQPNLSVPIDFTQGDASELVSLVNTLTDAKIYVIFDMHNYMRYNNQIIGQSPSVTAKNYADAWGQIAGQFKGNAYVFFDLMNEPHDMSTELILSNYNAAIASIRAQGADNLVLLEGNNYSGVAGWTQSWSGNTPSSQVFLPANIKDPSNNYAINVHEYFDSPTGGGGGSNECIDPSTVLTVEKFQDFIAYLQTYKLRAILTELGGLATANCCGCIDNFLTAVEQHPASQDVGGFIGWSAWAGGHSWGSYPLNLTPNPDGSEKMQMTQGFEKHLTPP